MPRPGAGAAAAGAGGATDLGALVGTGAGLAGGTTGLEGTLLAAGAPSIGGGALATGAGLGAAGTAADFLAAPSAVGGATSVGGGFGATADAAATEAASTGLASGLGASTDVLGGLSPTLSSAGTVPGSTPAGAGTTGAISPSAAPAAPGAATAPTGAAPSDLTSITGTGTGLPGGSTGLTGTNAAAGATPGGFTPDAPFNAPGSTVPGATGPTALGGSTGPSALPGAPSSSGFSLDNLVSNATKSITNNPLSLVGPAAGLGGLAYTLSQAKKQLPEQTALDSAALTATNTGNTLSSYLTSGTLPAGLQTAVDKATQDAKTAAISNAAKNGQSTDPTQNTSLAAQLASIDQQSTITTATVGQQLLSSGLSETQLASQDYSTLLNADMTQQGLISNAISSFAKSLGSLGTSGIKLNLGNSGVTATT